MADNYGDLLEKGIAPILDFILVDHLTRDKKYLCDGCGIFIWAFRLADMRKVPAVLKGNDPNVNFACDGCITTYERNHGATLPLQPSNPGPELWKGLGLTQGSNWRTKQKDWRDRVKVAQNS